MRQQLHLERFNDTYQRIAELGEEAGRNPIVLHTAYIDPFPAADQHQDCFDIEGGTSPASRVPTSTA